MEQTRCYGCMEPLAAPGICPKCGYDSSQPNAPHQLPAGTVLKEQYMIGKVLGQGGFGITYLGWDLYLDIPVAIKEYFPSGTVSRDTSVTMEVSSYTGQTGARFNNNKERFLREAKALARFSNIPEIVQVKNFFLSNNTAYIVMEYIKGITLKQFVQNQGGRLSVETTIQLLRPVMEALCKVHKDGLVHRDISPDNIMMLPNGQVKLLDFGAVRDVGLDAAVDKESAKSTEAILKQGYAPIEQYQSRGSLGPWTDVYALCATIYYCITGQVPPDAPERLLGDEELPLAAMVPQLTSHQVATLRKGMALRAEHRFISMDELYQALFGQVSSQPTGGGTVVVTPPGDTGTQKTGGGTVVVTPPGDTGTQKTGSGTVVVTPPGDTGTQKTGSGTVVVTPPGDTGSRQTGGSGTVVVTPPRHTGKQKPDNTNIQKKERKAPSKKVGLAVALTAVSLVLIGSVVGYVLFNGQDSTSSKEKDKNKDKDNSSLSSDRTPSENLSDVTGQCGDGLTWTLNRNTGEMVITGIGGIWDYGVIGERHGSDAPWQDYRQDIRSLTIGDGVTTVGAYAFEGCTNLKEVHFSDSITDIGSQAFCHTGLTELELPESLRKISGPAFANTALKEVRIPESVVEIWNAFWECKDLQVVYLESEDTEVSMYTFEGCTSLQRVVRAGKEQTLVYFECPDSWGSRPVLHVWNQIAADWSGYEMTRISDTTYCYILPEKPSYVVFELNVQTQIMAFPNDGANYYDYASDSWSVYGE